MTGYSSRQGGQYVPVNTNQTGFPRSAARSIVPPPTSGATSGGAGLPTSGNGDTDPFCGDAPEGALPLGAGAGDEAGDDDAPGADEASVTRTAGTGVSAITATPMPTAAPNPTANPITTAMKLRITGERSAWGG
jgi:hypothetical protein